MVEDWRSVLEESNVYDASFISNNRTQDRLEEAPEIVHFIPPFRQWDGEIVERAEHFGKGTKQVHSLDGASPVRSCNEVEVAKLLRKVRDRAYWVSSYAPSKVPELWKPWSIDPRALPDWIKGLDSKIRTKIPSKKGGIPDVIAWNLDESLESLVFVECKGPKESVKESQEDWMTIAHHHIGISARNLAVSIRPFA